MLIVGGTFDDCGGKRSYIVDKLAKCLGAVSLNGGSLKELRELDYSQESVLLWMPNIDNKEDKILPEIKKKNPHVLLIQSKRAIEKEYSESDVVGRMLQSRSLLGIMITKDSHYNYKLLDPLGNIYCDTKDLDILAKEIKSRTDFILGLSRMPSKSVGAARDFNIEKDFIRLVRSSGEEFTRFVNAVNPNRLLGNASTRCSFGFPAACLEDRVFVSRRNVEKRTLCEKDFVEAYIEDGEVKYYGESKPSVDTPVQLELFSRYPNIKYMIHGHVYVEGAPMTKHKIPCGFLEEVADILEAVPDTSVTEFSVNLLGHGCLVACKDLEYFDTVRYCGREFPESS